MSTQPDLHGAFADTDSLVGHIFALSGKFSEPHAALTSLLKRNAADVKASVTKAVTHLVSTVDDFEARSTKVQKALATGIPIVTERWVRESIEANEPLPLRPEYVLHPGNAPLAGSEEATKAKTSPRTATIDDAGRKAAEQEAAASAADVTTPTPVSTEGAAPPIAPTKEPEARIDESHLPSAIITQAKDASLPVLHPTIGEMRPAEHPPIPPQEAPPAVSAEAGPKPREGPAVPTPEEETARIQSTAAAEIPPVPSPTHEQLEREAASAPGAMTMELAEEKAEVPVSQEALAGEKRGAVETQQPPALPAQEEPPQKRQKIDEEGEEGRPQLQRAPPSDVSSAAVQPPSEAQALPVAPTPAVQVTPSGAETGGPSAMQVTQRAYDLKVLQRKEYGPSTAHEMKGTLEKQLLEGLNVHNDSTVGFGSLDDAFARGVDGGAVLVESVRDYHAQDYYTIISYGRGGKEFGSVHRNDETLSCGLLRDGVLSAVREDDADLMARLMHVHLPIITVVASS